MNDLTISKLADLLGVHRITVYRQIKKGQIKALMIGKVYVIQDEEVQRVLFGKITETEKSNIKKVIKKIQKQYNKTLKLLKGI